MNNSTKTLRHDGSMIDIEAIRREYGSGRGSSHKRRRDSRVRKLTPLLSTRRWIGDRLWNIFDWLAPFVSLQERSLGLRQHGRAKSQRGPIQNSPRPPAGTGLDLLGLDFGAMGKSRKKTVQNSPRRQAGVWRNLLGLDLQGLGSGRRGTMQKLPGRQAGQLGRLLEQGSDKMRAQEFKNTMKISPSRTMLPHFLILPWWMVFIVLGGTAVVSVSYSEGEEHQVTEENALENQGVEVENFNENLSEEASLVKQLQDRLKELEEREQRLQQKEARIDGLQRDVEALAKRQAQEAERLKQRAAELNADNSEQAGEDPSLTHLVKVYNAMDPEEAALRIEKMDERLALEILFGIKDKKAAVVLAGVNPAKAAALSQGLRNFKMEARK